jgi:hypothetical protein
LPALELCWQRGKIASCSKCHILSGSVDARDPRLGGAVADIGGFRQKSASFELRQPGLRLRYQGRYSGGRSRQTTFVVSYYLLHIS